MARPIAYLDADLDPMIDDRYTLAAGMALEKHFDRYTVRPREPEESRERMVRALTTALASPRIVPPIRVAILHEPDMSTPAAVSGGGDARAVRTLVASATDRIWLQGPATRLRTPSPPWPGCERIATEDIGLAAFRIPPDLDAAAIVAQFGRADRDKLYLLGCPHGSLDDPRDYSAAFAGHYKFDDIVMYARRARWVLTSHAVWPDWVPFCVYTEADPRTLPGLDSPDVIWIDSPRDPAAPRLPESNTPSVSEVADLATLRRAETIDLEDTLVVSVAELAAYPRLRAVSVAGCTAIHRDELGQLTRLESLDLRRVAMRDYEPLRGLTQLRTLWVDLPPRTGWAALAALPDLAHLCLDRIVALDVGELAELLRARSLTLSFGFGVQEPPSISPLARAAQLEALDIHLQHADPTALAAFPHLRALSISGTGGADAALARAICDLDQLTGLATGDLESLRSIPTLPALRRLDVSVKRMDGLDRLPPLDYLGLHHGMDSSPTIELLEAQPNLSSLYLSGFEELPIRQLRALPRLEALGLGSMMFEMADVAGLTKLRRFETSEDNVDLAPFRHHPALETLVLHGADQLTCPEALLDMPALRRFVVRQPILPEPIALELEARGVVVATHPLDWGFRVYGETIF